MSVPARYILAALACALVLVGLILLQLRHADSDEGPPRPSPHQNVVPPRDGGAKTMNAAIGARFVFVALRSAAQC
jgi:hypothetical protein